MYALTQFEPTDARKAFPCWDEPALKATYSLTMISADTSVNLSNMDAISETALDAASAPNFGQTEEVGKTMMKTLKTLKTEHLKTEQKTEKTEQKTEKTESTGAVAKKPEAAWKITRFAKTPLMSTCESRSRFCL